MQDSTSFITVVSDRQIRFSVPADLHCISTFVLLEQGRWFEKEIDFIHRYAVSGMTALDIGANIGAYTLPLAQLVGPGGQVVAYEPGTVSRQHLERSLVMNLCHNVTVSGAALSDFAGAGWLKIEKNAELNQLVTEHTGTEQVESIHITTLDFELEKFNWAQVDFMKIDAEGQEVAIVTGGQKFFKRYSPLIMFEINHNSVVNHGLIEALRALGFDIYRLLGDGTLLVPDERLDKIDFFEVNLFAARPEQAAHLTERGLLARHGAAPVLSDTERRQALANYLALPFAQAFEIEVTDIEQCPFGEALVAYTAYRFLGALSPDRRLALLQHAYDELAHYCETTHSAAALSTLSRAAHDLGYRGIATEVLAHLLDTKSFSPDQPFFPPAPQFEDDHQAAAEGRFTYAATEVLETRSYISTCSGHDMERLEWLAAQEAASDSILKRLILIRIYFGRPADEVRDLVARLQTRTDGHCVWCDTVRSLMAGK
ncbi:MAG: FkbM family methyltransferase [Rhodocyclaceae bacterium]|nr:MAG: FkbM family methyltransferase [Rhodocyclaceae bacterium]TND04924.1 MAG: FkbM family methyltransferase [Rhodocyclaceae bacterium]